MILIIKTGEPFQALLARRGDFPAWIVERGRLPRDRVHVVDVRSCDRLPDTRSVAGVIVTGSSAMVSACDEWSVRTGEWLARAVQADVPLLGICYGHQLLARALGGRVENNPRGREIGTVAVELAPEAASDALFFGFPRAIRVQSTHVESVTHLPTGATLLGGNAADPHQAYRVGSSAWGVQFHPEFDADIITSIVAVRAEVLRAEGLDPEAIAARASDSGDGASILARFGELITARL